MKWWPITSEKASVLRASASSSLAQIVHAPVVDAAEPGGDRLVAPGPVADGQVDRQQLAGEGERARQPQPGPGVAALALDAVEHLIDAHPLPAVEHLLQQRPPVGEMPVEAALGHAERLRQNLDPDGVRAARGEGPQALLDPPATRRP